ncbi:carboxypeptidase-like regulatory domain-containing protein [Elizabethkingia anophelis]
MKKILIPLILCSSISLMAQHTISGQVLDEPSHSPLRNVTIALKNSSTAVLTDSNGFFKLHTKENKIELMAQFWDMNPKP